MPIVCLTVCQINDGEIIVFYRMSLIIAPSSRVKGRRVYLAQLLNTKNSGIGKSIKRRI